MEERKKHSDVIREEKKKQLLKFIERKKTRIIPLEKVRAPLYENRKEQVPPVNEENVPRETEKTYIEGSNRRKKRREKLQKIKEKRDEIKKKRALAIHEERQRREKERKHRREEQQKKKLEVLKKKEEARQLKEVREKEALEKRKEAIKKREEARLLQEAKRKEEAEKKRAEALKKQEEIRQLKEAKKEEALLLKAKKTIPVKKVIPAKEIPSTTYAKRKEELLEFLRTRKILYEQENERKKTLKQISIEKKKISVISPIDKEKVKIPAKTVEKVRKEILPAAVTAKISALSKESKRTEKEAEDSVSISYKKIKHFISTFTKEKKERIEKPVPVPEKKPIVKYREPFLLMPFIRRNIFKFVFLILLIIWLYEILFFMGRFQDPQKRLSDIVGEDVTKEESVYSAPVKEEKLPVTEAEFKIALKKEKIDIEGKRDPFSPGRLTMEVFEKPAATSIVLASKPDVISILRPSRVVSILREEKKMEPEKVASISKPQTPSYQPIIKEKAPSPIQAVEEKVKPAEISSLIMPERRCDLIYRGRLVIEGVEYLFIEGKNKTYRVTIGDVVEGFRILKKEKDKIYLSKEGIIYEIPVD
ncbi:MAG: hypothetical protein NC905_04300 [Candidatus Omnitrophica bacterium]|nr:hypothetical protein [Candidatus Omnitrophota bacterium]